MAKGSFTQEEAEESSTIRELRGTYYVLSSLVEEVRGKVVHHRTENLNVVRVLSVGSKKLALQHEVVRIFRFCLENNVQLHPEWIPREQNVVDDAISKQFDPDDYMLDPTIFAALNIMYGPHTVDCFSSFRTRQIPWFNSKWLNPLTEGIDALTLSWEGENNWLFLPPYLIPKALHHMQVGQEDGTLIVPWQTSAP